MPFCYPLIVNTLPYNFNLTMLERSFNKKYLPLLLLILGLSSLNAQYSHRAEIFIDKTFSWQKSGTSFTPITNSHQSIRRNGGGVNLGIKYNIPKTPLNISLGYEISKSEKPEIVTNVVVYEDYNTLDISSGNLSIAISPLTRSTIKPYLTFGVDYSNIKYSKGESKYIVFEYGEVFEYNESPVLIDVNTIGYILGAGTNIRITDNIGANLSFRFRMLPQNKSNILDDMLMIKTLNIGIYYRIGKMNSVFKL